MCVLLNSKFMITAKVVVFSLFCASGLAQNGLNFPSRHQQRQRFQFGDGFFAFVPRSINGFNSGNQAIPHTTVPPWGQNFGGNPQINFYPNENQQANFQNQNPWSANQNFGSNQGEGSFYPNENQQSSFQNQNQNPWSANQNFGSDQGEDIASNSNIQGNQQGNRFQNQNFVVPTTTRRSETQAPTTQTPILNKNFGWNQQGGTIQKQNFAEPDDECVAVDGSIGSCINIKFCPPFIDLLRSLATNPQGRETLRKAHCGFDGNNPKVCCPKSQPIPTALPIILEPQSPPTEDSKNAQTPEPWSEPLVEEPPEEPDTTSRYVNELPEPPICGKNNDSSSRVVGGVDAKLGQFPWMALLGYHSSRYPEQTRWLCGGSLVTDRHALTAAHCIHGRERDLYLVRLGELDLSREDEGATPVDVPIKEKIKHEGYSAKSFTNDIGILLLERAVQFTDLIRPICLPRSQRLRSLTFERYHPFIAGWGDTEFRGPSAQRMQVLQLPVVSNEFCANAYRNYKAQVIDERVLCAGYERGGKDACQGDSGGPLMQPDADRDRKSYNYFQIGVVSYGRKCAEAGFPGVYTRITHFMPWLYEKIVGKSLP